MIVLLVDDELDILEAYPDFMPDFTWRTACRFDDALRIIETEKIDDRSYATDLLHTLHFSHKYPIFYEKLKQTKHLNYNRAVVAESVRALYSLELYHAQGRGFESGRYLFRRLNKSN